MKSKKGQIPDLTNKKFKNTIERVENVLKSVFLQKSQTYPLRDSTSLPAKRVGDQAGINGGFIYPNR
jgi:hypothetical protein